ncbi:MAG: hypothetical protein ABIS67_08890 [Candidatus Eisenbacteria bacterium]
MSDDEEVDETVEEDEEEEEEVDETEEDEEEEVAEEFEGSSGGPNPYDVEMETRTIVIGFGTDFHGWDWFKEELGGEITQTMTVNDDDEIEIDHPDQGIHYVIRQTESKQEFRDALETEDLMVIYAGHSRYGRGFSFAQVFNELGVSNAEPGEHWENGSDDDDGLLRWAFPYLTVHLEDIDQHQYTFRPVSAAEEPPPRSERHPEAAAEPEVFELTEKLRKYVDPDYAADDHKYWGYRGGIPGVLVHAGWKGTPENPFELDKLNLQCRCLCLFSCSTRLHFRPLLRGNDYKAWQRDESGNSNYAYFTTAPAPPPPSACIWVSSMIKSTKVKAGENWHAGLKDTLELANRKVRQKRVSDRGGYGFDFF